MSKTLGSLLGVMAVAQLGAAILCGILAANHLANQETVKGLSAMASAAGCLVSTTVTTMATIDQFKEF